MNILPVMNVRCNTTSDLNKRCNNMNSTPTFCSALNNAQVDRVLHILKNKVTDVQVLGDISGIKGITDTLMVKYQPFGINSIGAIVVPEGRLAEFINNQNLLANIDDYRGICVAVGDKHGPVETWTKAYQAIVALIPKSKM